MKAKKYLGQNFLKNEYFINRINDAINVFSNTLIVEIGPGRGALTKVLKTKNCNLVAYEIDLDLKNILTNLEDNKTKIIWQDFLSVDKLPEHSDLCMVGNLPYYITTPILEHIIDCNFDPRELVVMVQKEVGNRFLASPGTKEYGYFTLILKYHFNITKVIDVPKTAFNPEPKVESTVLKLTKRYNKPDIDFKTYQEFLKKAFRQKRKQLKNNLSDLNWLKIKDILVKHGLKETVRAEELSEEVLVEIGKNTIIPKG